MAFLSVSALETVQPYVEIKKCGGFEVTPLHLCCFESCNALEYKCLSWVQQSRNCYIFWCNGFATVAPHLIC